MCSPSGYLTTPIDRQQIDRLQKLCKQAKHTYYACSEAQCDISEFSVSVAKIKDELNIAEKLWGTNPPATKEMDLLLKRLETLLLLPPPFDLKGMRQYEAVFKIFHSVLPTQNKVPLLCVNNDWNTKFKAFEDAHTHEQVTAQLPSLGTNLAVLDADLDTPLDKGSAATIRALIRESQEVLEMFRYAHVSRQNWSIFDLEDLEAEIKDVLATALKTLGPETLTALFSSIEKTRPCAFFQDLKMLTDCYKKIDASQHPHLTKSESLKTLISAKVFKKIQGWIVANDLGVFNYSACKKFLSTLTQTGRYKQGFAFVRILIANPGQLHIPPEQVKSLCTDFIKLLCKQKHFNKACEAFELIPIKPWDSKSLKTIVSSLSTNGLSKKASSMVLKAPSKPQRISLFLSIVNHAKLIEKKKFQEVAELALSIKTELSDWSPPCFPTSEWMNYAQLIQKTPKECLQEMGINKTKELEAVATKILLNPSVNHTDKKEVLNLIPAGETEVRKRIEALADCPLQLREPASEILATTLNEGWFSQKIMDIALEGLAAYRRIELLSFIAKNSEVTETKEFAAAAQLVCLLKKELLEWRYRFSSTFWFSYATLIHNIPQAFLQEQGINKTQELARACITILQRTYEDEEIQQILDWIPTEEIEVHAHIQDLLSKRARAKELNSRVITI